MRIFHLSHTDLDGYSCQLVTKEFFDSVHCYNSNYGNEVTAKLEQIESHMSRFSAKEPKMLLITDLNITKDECKLVEKISSRLTFMGHNITIKLLDHHKSGEAIAKDYDWYFLDNSRCATLITYDWCREKLPNKTVHKDLAEFVRSVNAYDIWLTDDEARFEFGKVLNRLLMDSREISALMFASEDTAYRLAVLKSAFEYIDGNKFVELDDNILRIKKEFLRASGDHNTLDNLTANFVVKMLSKNRELLTIHYGEYRGILTYQIGNSSVLGNAFLKANEDYDFFMDINRNGGVSLRADGKIDVSVMSNRLFGGGGHANAAGGKIQNFKEVFVYEQLRDRILEIVK